MQECNGKARQARKGKARQGTLTFCDVLFFLIFDLLMYSCVYVCMYACLFGCLLVCLYVCLYVCIRTCVSMSLNVFTFVCGQFNGTKCEVTLCDLT